MTQPLLEIENLDIQYRTKTDDVRAVSDASIKIDTKEYMGLVGESGSGKSTIAKAIIGGLDHNGVVTNGEIKYKGEEIQDLTEDELTDKIRWKEISYIPQASMSSLDPIMTLKEQARTIAKAHTDWNEEKATKRLKEMFEVVGLPEERINDYPHQFSGGMQQRAIISLALYLDPDLIIADEPTTALDVIMQDQIMKYVDNIKHTSNTSLLLITHDISVVFETCDTVAVLHGGQVSEIGDIYEVYDNPRHPYSLLLQHAFPNIRYPDRELLTIEGEPPQLREDVDYCTFADRCPWAEKECVDGAPELKSVGDESKKAACVRREEIPELAKSYSGSKSEKEVGTHD